MRYVICDLELDQPHRELIQIGAVYVDTKANKIFTEINIFVNIGKKLNPEIVELTGITDETLETKGVPLGEALETFCNWIEETQCRDFMDWGGGDYATILRDLKTGPYSHNTERFQKLRHHDLKKMSMLLRSLYPGKKKNRGGLLNTTKLLDIEFEGRQHDALVDAKNTAYVLFKMNNLLQLGIECETYVKGRL